MLTKQRLPSPHARDRLLVVRRTEGIVFREFAHIVELRHQLPHGQRGLLCVGARHVVVNKAQLAIFIAAGFVVDHQAAGVHLAFHLEGEIIVFGDYQAACLQVGVHIDRAPAHQVVDPQLAQHHQHADAGCVIVVIAVDGQIAIHHQGMAVIQGAVDVQIPPVQFPGNTRILEVITNVKGPQALTQRRALAYGHRGEPFPLEQFIAALPASGPAEMGLTPGEQGGNKQ